MIAAARRALAAWIALWDRREPPTAQAVVRILVGACLLWDLLLARALGVVDAVWAPPPHGMGYGASEALWSVRWLGATPEMAHTLWWAAVLSIAAFTAGAATRVAGVVFVLVSAQLGYLAPDGDRGIDIALRVVIAVLVLSSCHARWSVDAWVRRRLGRPFPAEVPAWPRLLLFAQLLWIYFSGGHNKLGAEWFLAGEFSALANVLSDPHFARFETGWVASIYPLTQLATVATMAFELGAPLMILWAWGSAAATRPWLRRWCGRLRWAWIAVGAGFHLGIAVFMNLGIFPWGMLAIYPVLLRPDEVARAEAWLRARAARVTAGSRSRGSP